MDLLKIQFKEVLAFFKDYFYINLHSYNKYFTFCSVMATSIELQNC